ncbi:MAG: ABC transporter permease, partial [Limnothrix sp.]
IDINEVVNKTLEQIEMGDRQDTFVRSLSGGQLKRVSIGVELLADPKLFFLDEPTSGLDPGLDKKMMQLLRKLANQGRTIILVTHATSNITQCDRIVFLGRGGNLCYFGPPDEAMEFFDIQTGDFADIYIKLESKQAVEAEAHNFHASPYCQRYVKNRLSGSSLKTENRPPRKARRSFLQQLAILSSRYFKLIVGDKVNLGLSLFTAPIAILLIYLALKDQDPLVPDADVTNLAPLALRVLFVFTCTALWVGFSSSLQEIVKESAIYLRERLVNLGLFAYLGSKVLILGGVAIAQSLLMSIVIVSCFSSPQGELLPWFIGVTVTTFLTLLTCNCMGLMVSASVKNSSQANSALPLLLLPQIIFSGVLFAMESGLGKYASWLMLSRWSVGAYGILVNVNELLPEMQALPDGTIPDLPFDWSEATYEPTWNNLWLNWGMLLIHSAVYLLITFWIQKKKDILEL